MGEMKPWQIVLFVAALAVLGGSVWYSLRGGGPDIKDEIYLLDFSTGQLYVASTQRVLILPAKSPETGERTLWPVSKGEDGGWTMSENTRRHLDKLPDDVVYNEETGEIQIDASSAIRYKRD